MSYRKLAFMIVFTLLALCLSALLLNKETRAQAMIESKYRAPIIGTFTIVRIDCAGHRGIGRFMDLATNSVDTAGTPIYSSGDGIVTIPSYDPNGFGNSVQVDNTEVTFWYAHLDKIYVRQGDRVSKGDLLGLIGSTGMSTGDHLHWDALAKNGDGFDIMKIPDVHTITYDPPAGQVCQYYGSVTGAPLFGWNSCPEFYNYMQDKINVYGPSIARVVLFDHKDCSGNRAVVPNNQTYDLTTFNDRTRSIYVPPGKSVVVSANVNDPMGLHTCHTIDMWNVDVDHYDNSTVTLGWNDAISLPSDPSDAGPYGSAGWNMISSVTVLNNGSCLYNAATIIAAAPGIPPEINGEVISAPSPPTATFTPGSNDCGRTPVEVFANPGFDCSQRYGWSASTVGWYNLSPDQNWLDDKISSVRMWPNWSLMVARDVNGGGSQKCINTPVSDLYNAFYSDGGVINDTISSVWIYSDRLCGGQYQGVAPGDQVTVWTDPNFFGTAYGWHDPVRGDLPSYMANAVSAIGVTPGWSIVVYSGRGQGGASECFTATAYDLWWMRDPMNDAIQSVAVYHDGICGGNKASPTPTNTPTFTPTPTATPGVRVSANVSPAVITAGGTVTYQWATNDASGQNWVSIWTLDEMTGYVAYDTGNLMQGTLSLVAPDDPGTYVVKYFHNGQMISISDSFQVVPAISSVTVSPAQVNPGGNVTLSWVDANPTTGNHIGLYVPGAQEAIYICNWFTAGDVVGRRTFTAPVQPGSYELRLYWVNQLVLTVGLTVVGPTWTPTSTGTITPSVTPTFTVTPTRTPTLTRTPSATGPGLRHTMVLPTKAPPGSTWTPTATQLPTLPWPTPVLIRIPSQTPGSGAGMGIPVATSMPLGGGQPLPVR